MVEEATGVRPGLTGEAAFVVTDEVSAAHLGSGRVPVLGTPALLRLMEMAPAPASGPG